MKYKTSKKERGYSKKYRQENPKQVIYSRRKIWDKYRIMLRGFKINGCAVCGYDKCLNALSFHHVNPENKKFCICIGCMHYKDKKIIEEINKCILLCCRCHKEIHQKESEKMGSCNNCGKKILYNKYKHYRRKILCSECYSTRLVRKAAEKVERRKKAALVKIVAPSKRAKKAAKQLGDDVIPSIYSGDYENEGSKAEDSN